LGQQILQLGSKQIDEQRHHQAPGQDAAGEVQRRELGPNDVAHTDVRGAHGGRRNIRDATGGERIGPRGRTQRNLAQAQLPHAQHELFVGREETARAGEEHARAERHAGEEVLRRFRAASASFVNLGRRHRFRERERLVFDHDAPDQ
jgi:hypothetical protein